MLPQYSDVRSCNPSFHSSIELSHLVPANRDIVRSPISIDSTSLIYRGCCTHHKARAAGVTPMLSPHETRIRLMMISITIPDLPIQEN
jgi:hypothetical protein